MIEIKGKSNISVKVILDSISEAGQRITTFEIEVPRIVWSEIMTHRMFSRNAASSRAIPFKKMLDQLNGKPVRFGQANSGMQDRNEDYKASIDGRYEEYETGIGLHSSPAVLTPEQAWEGARQDAIFWSNAFHQAGYHKQVVNRITEPYQIIKGVITATEFANFSWLRNDTAADPTLQELARCMLEGFNASKPKVLMEDNWHLPFVETRYIGLVSELQYIVEGVPVSIEDAIKVSSARCAAVSFRNEDYGMEKCLEVYARLVSDERKHSSAMEHQAKPINRTEYNYLSREYPLLDCYQPQINHVDSFHTWEPGISHVDRQGNFWSGNFKGWIQHRKLIPGENHDS